jgi:hypothetical protein
MKRPDYIAYMYWMFVSLRGKDVGLILPTLDESTLVGGFADAFRFYRKYKV